MEEKQTALKRRSRCSSGVRNTAPPLIHHSDHGTVGSNHSRDTTYTHIV